MLVEPLILLFVNVSVDVSVTTFPSALIETLLSVTVVVKPLPPSNINVSPKFITSEVEESSLIVIDELDNLSLPILPASFPAAIEPSSWSLVIVPTKEEVG